MLLYVQSTKLVTVQLFRADLYENGTWRNEKKVLSSLVDEVAHLRAAEILSLVIFVVKLKLMSDPRIKR